MRDVEETQEIKPVFECLAGDTVFFPLTFFGERDNIEEECLHSYTKGNC